MPLRGILTASLFFFAASASAQPSNAVAPHDQGQWSIFEKFYPPRAIAAHEEGTVGFRVTLDSKGEVTGCAVTRTSGHALLDEETCQLITLHAQFRPDAGLSPSQVRTSEGQIVWRLPATTPAGSAASKGMQGSQPEKIVCKRTLRTGSLAGFDRTCMTPSEWAKRSDEQKSFWEDLQGKKGSTSGN